MRAARVIGAGLSGLASAWHLAERGYEVTVVDRASRPGGLIGTQATEYGLVETAANAFVRDDVVDAWFARLGLTALTPQRESRRRYIFRDGKPRRWPLRVGESAAFAMRFAGAGITRQLRAQGNESMAEWGHRVIGPAATDWLLEPAMQGIYATRAARLSAAVLFSARKRGRREMVAPAKGMGEFAERLHHRLIERDVRFEFNRAVDALDPATPTVVATDAQTAAQLLRQHAEDVADRLAAIGVAPLVSVTMFFEPHPGDVRGFGVLFPESTGVAALGVLFNGDIFAGRSAVRSETWIVGDRDRGLIALADGQLLETLLHDRFTLYGRHATPLSTHITRWPRAIPIYDRAIVDLQASLTALPPWLALAGNSLGRIGVSALLAGGESAAARLAPR